jgi:hypothetical protein
MVEVRLRELDDELETAWESAKTGVVKVPSTPDEKVIKSCCACLETLAS